MGLQLLVVDHSTYIQERLRDLLENLSDVSLFHTAANMPQAVEAVEQHAVDVAIVDGDLPDNKSFVLLQVLKKDYPHVRVIMLLNNSFKFIINLCKRIGSDYCLDKANEFDQIPSILTSLAQKSKSAG